LRSSEIEIVSHKYHIGHIYRIDFVLLQAEEGVGRTARRRGSPNQP
jgi:hypothetical protein